MSIFELNNGIASLFEDRLLVDNSSETLNVGASCGCFHMNKIFVGTFKGELVILSPARRTEKVIEAHNGCVITCNYFNDCIITTGEDGMAKMWSSNGALRATLTKSILPIRAVTLNANSLFYGVQDRFFSTDIFSSVKKSYHANFIVTALFSVGPYLVVGGINGKLKLFENLNLLKEINLESKIFSICLNLDLQLIYVGLFNQIMILDLALRSVQNYTANGIVYNLYSKDNGQIYFITSKECGTLYYFKPYFSSKFIVSCSDYLTIENVSSSISHVVEHDPKDIKKIKFGNVVILVLKNKLLIFDNQEYIIDVSFEVRDIQLHDW
eukprot:NODE_39_length_35218_cov_0.479655.p12 type:complete len:325 gc:universal NODE_39_length_35218_cov_0.479655:7511-8485(+)